MEGDRIEMSQRERDVLKVMTVVLEGKRTQTEAARILARSVRQVRRIQRRLESQGDIGVVHGLRGRPSNRRMGDDLRRQVVVVYQRDYGDFGPTLAAEKMRDRGMDVSADTLRRWLINAGAWEGRRRREKHRSRRERRACFGEMVQADGSPHDWLEGRGEQMTLLVMIDDATSKALARFHPAETTEGYMGLLRRYLRKHGRMVAMYVDGNSIFREESREGEPAALTQFGRACEELGIKLIPAYSPQAKGRVERFNGTAQDRLVKELRLAGACTIQEANEVLERLFLPWFNRNCTVKPTSPNDAHRGLDPSMNLSAILSIQDMRTVANDYTIRHHTRAYQILPPPEPGLRGGKVVVERRLDGTHHLRFKGKYLSYQILGPSAGTPGALPPAPRSLTHARTPAGMIKDEGRAAVAARPPAVCPTLGRSGRTPAGPCPPRGGTEDNTRPRWRPRPDHPWRKPMLLSHK